MWDIFFNRTHSSTGPACLKGEDDPCAPMVCFSLEFIQPLAPSSPGAHNVAVERFWIGGKLSVWATRVSIAEVENGFDKKG